MANGMWLEHPDGQQQAEDNANALRDIAATMPAGKTRESLLDIAAFLGAISDPDCPPMTRQELRDAAAWRAENRDEVERREARMRSAVTPSRSPKTAAE